MSYIQKNQKVFEKIMKAIAAEFGSHCEIVLHDLTLPYDHTIVAIENGHVTNRKIGDSGTNIGLEVLRGSIVENDRYNYVNKTQDGKLLRSTSVYFKDKKNKTVGSLCINFDITGLIQAENTIKEYANSSSPEEVEEFFTGNIDDLLDKMLQETIRRIGKSVRDMTKEDKLQAIKYLDNKGIFLVKKSMDTVSDFFEISKFTLYNYLDEVRKQ
ncbi:transcriptional regulator [Treponema parvum]|uniref:Transcriptional regulator n=1 Tax=Treponema parvum TaxID=138851 RepID=A0A975EZI0_9SPIR|nr:helix-turn-helix transcriptional regulator [Treponema parvum]QTQ11274.1 transcriptional regulator [Treponema parvum]